MLYYSCFNIILFTYITRFYFPEKINISFCSVSHSIHFISEILRNVKLGYALQITTLFKDINYLSRRREVMHFNIRKVKMPDNISARRRFHLLIKGTASLLIAANFSRTIDGRSVVCVARSQFKTSRKVWLRMKWGWGTIRRASTAHFWEIRRMHLWPGAARLLYSRYE